CRLLEISGGATNFTAHSLGNSRCRDIRFEGGGGDVTLDLSGAWAEDATINVEVALGEVNLQLPPDVGISLTVDRFLAGLDAAGFTRVGDRYLTPGFEQAKRHLVISVSCTVGEVNVEWLEQGAGAGSRE
ncbi:MAG: LiaF domain-containing protein, partial [Gemmatimonadales bacterium]